MTSKDTHYYLNDRARKLLCDYGMVNQFDSGFSKPFLNILKSNLKRYSWYMALRNSVHAYCFEASIAEKLVICTHILICKMESPIFDQLLHEYYKVEGVIDFDVLRKRLELEANAV